MKPSPLSREFALTVAGWTVSPVLDAETGSSWELWRNENGIVVSPPTFAESVDLLLPYVNKFTNIFGGDGTWSASFIVNERNDLASGYAVSMSEALAQALIKGKGQW